MSAARPATAGDKPALAHLRAEASIELASQRGGRILLAESGAGLEGPSGPGGAAPRSGLEGPSGPGGAAPRSGLEGPSGHEHLAVVGTFDEVVVGFGRVQLSPDPSLPAVVDAFYVEKAGRGVGVGEAMMELMVSWARANGATGVDASALPGSRASKAFFEEQGFVTRLLVMHRSLDPKP